MLNDFSHLWSQPPETVTEVELWLYVSGLADLNVSSRIWREAAANPLRKKLIEKLQSEFEAIPLETREDLRVLSHGMDEEEIKNLVLFIYRNDAQAVSSGCLSKLNGFSDFIEIFTKDLENALINAAGMIEDGIAAEDIDTMVVELLPKTTKLLERMHHSPELKDKFDKKKKEFEKLEDVPDVNDGFSPFILGNQAAYKAGPKAVLERAMLMLDKLPELIGLSSGLGEEIAQLSAPKHTFYFLIRAFQDGIWSKELAAFALDLKAVLDDDYAGRVTRLSMDRWPPSARAPEP